MPGKKEYIERLKLTVEQFHNCSAVHVSSVYVTEVVRGKIAWEGHVEVFILIGHPKAKRCYGWSDADPEQFVTILELPPVDSPESAVKAGLAQIKKAKP